MRRREREGGEAGGKARLRWCDGGECKAGEMGWGQVEGGRLASGTTHRIRKPQQRNCASCGPVEILIGMMLDVEAGIERRLGGELKKRFGELFAPTWWIVGATLIGSVVAILWVAWALHAPEFAQWALRGQSPSEAGEWGDSFGAFNALFGALGFTAIVATLWLQGSALKRQQRDIHRQRFDELFFQLLRMLREAREEVRFRHSLSVRHAAPMLSSDMLEGHAAVRAAYREAQHWIEAATEDKWSSKPFLARLYFRRVHARYESTFGAYFRLLYAILDRIREDPVLTEEEKDHYGNLVRGQFTYYEAGLAGLNGLMDISKDFSDLVVRFRLLKYLRDGSIKRALEHHYKPETFQGRPRPGWR